MPNFQKGFAQVVVLAVLFLGILGFFIWSWKQPNRDDKVQPSAKPVISTPIPTPYPSPDVKTDKSGKFKTYTNHVENYTFNFPIDWNLTEAYSKVLPYDDPRIDNPVNVTAMLSKEGESFIFITIEVDKPEPRRENDQTQNVAKAGNRKKYEDQAENIQQKVDEVIAAGGMEAYIKIGNKLVSNQKAVQTIKTAVPGAPTEATCNFDTVFDYGVFTYTIQAKCDAFRSHQIMAEAKKAYDQILGSFKLTGPIPTKVPITLKTYEDKINGYSFQYTSNWLVNSGDYSKGVIVVNGNDVEMLTLSKETRYGNKCPKLGEDQKVNLGGKEVVLTFDCDNPRVKSSKGEEFEMHLDLKDQRILYLLKSMQGMTVVKPQ